VQSHISTNIIYAKTIEKPHQPKQEIFFTYFKFLYFDKYLG